MKWAQRVKNGVVFLHFPIECCSFTRRTCLHCYSSICLGYISTPSLPIVRQYCWAPTNFHFFFAGIFVGTSLPKVWGRLHFPELWPNNLPFWSIGMTSIPIVEIEIQGNVYVRVWHCILPAFPFQHRTGQSPQHSRRSGCWATTLGRQIWHPNNRMGSHPNNNFPKKSSSCWIPTHFYNFKEEMLLGGVY